MDVGRGPGADCPANNACPPATWVTARDLDGVGLPWKKAPLVLLDDGGVLITKSLACMTGAGADLAAGAGPVVLLLFHHLPFWSMGLR